MRATVSTIMQIRRHNVKDRFTFYLKRRNGRFHFRCNDVIEWKRQQSLYKNNIGKTALRTFIKSDQTRLDQIV